MYPSLQQSGNNETYRYEKAKHDLIEAVNSFADLTLQQKEQLIVEVFGASMVAQFFQIMQNSNNGGGCHE